MEILRNYIYTLSDMLATVFESTEHVCVECRELLNLMQDHTVFADELKERNMGLMTLFQFGDIICQSFESFDVIFEELNRFENPEEKLSHDQAERFSRLVGAVSTNTFSLVGKTMVHLNESLHSTKKILLKMAGSQAGRDPFKREAIEKCIKTIDRNVLQIETSARQAVLSTEKIGLFCIEKIISMKLVDDNKSLSERLYEKFRVREHVEILSSLFPTDRHHSDTGSLELF